MDKPKGFLEESLAESQGKDVCRAIFDGSPDAIFLADPKTGLIIDANPAAELLVGRPLKDLIGLHQSALHPRRKEEASSRLFKEHCSGNGKPAPAAADELYALRSDGAEVPIEITASLIKIKGRKVLQGFFRDVSARKRAQDALRESEALYRSLVDHAPVGIALHRMGAIKFVNRKMAELGRFRDPAALLGRDITEFIHPQDRELAARRIQLLMRDRVPLPPQATRLVAPDGTVYDMEMLSILINYQGEECVMSIILDITDRKRTQDELRESEERYRALVNHAPMGIVVHYLGTIRFINRRLGEMVGVADTKSYIGRNLMDFIHPEFRTLVRQRIDTMMKADAPLPPTEEKLVALDGKALDVEVTSVPLTYRGERCVLALVQDIGARKRAQEEIARAQRQLLEANALLEERVEQRTSQLEDLNKELEAFSYSAAHDLKAPLRRINIFSDMLEKAAGNVLCHDTHDYLVNIHKSVRNMTRLVDGLLSLSTTGRRPLDLEKTDLSEVLDEALAEVKAEHPGREIEWRTQKLPALKCDRSMLRQVLVNLLGNAAKYSRGRRPARIEVFYSAGPREHVVAVRDNGIGFSMEYADKVFGVFQRLHKSEDYEGTGIGLSTVKRIVSRHGGRVWAESEPGKGSTFFFSLPSRQDPPAGG